MSASRYLHGMEELFWFYEQASSFAPVFCVELHGLISNPNWDEHLRRLQELYPLLRCRIHKSSGDRARFEEVATLGIPLITKELDSSIELEMQRELDRGFLIEDLALARLTVCRTGDRVLILLCAHHAAFDGRSMIMIIRDLLAMAAGEPIDANERRAASIGELLSIGPVRGYADTLKEKWVLPSKTTDKPSSVVRKVVSQEDTATVLASCRSHDVSVSAALTAALAEAGRGVRTCWRQRSLNCLVPVDLRPFFGGERTSGLLIGVLSAAIPMQEDGNVWKSAADIHGRLKNATSTDAFVKQADMMRKGFAREQQHADVLKQLRASATPTDISVNNYGKEAFRSDYGAFRVVNASSGSLTSYAGGQKISMISLDGRMTLTATSVEPIPGILDKALRILLERWDVERPLLR
jgi:hypothetical protein